MTNIWAGIGAGVWAVSKADSPQTEEARKTRSLRMTQGSYGLLYCSATKTFTTPFKVRYEAKWTSEKIFGLKNGGFRSASNLLARRDIN
jgi:hypothetical protein